VGVDTLLYARREVALGRRESTEAFHISMQYPICNLVTGPGLTSNL